MGSTGCTGSLFRSLSNSTAPFYSRQVRLYCFGSMFSVVCTELQFDRQLNVIRCHCRARNPCLCLVCCRAARSPGAVVEAVLDGASLFTWEQKDLVGMDGVLSLVLDQLAPGGHEVSVRSKHWRGATFCASFVVVSEISGTTSATNADPELKEGCCGWRKPAAERAASWRPLGKASLGGSSARSVGAAQLEVRILSPLVNEVLQADLETGVASLEVSSRPSACHSVLTTVAPCLFSPLIPNGSNMSTRNKCTGYKWRTIGAGRGCGCSGAASNQRSG